MRKFSWMLLAMLVLLVFSAGCQDQPKVEQKPQPSVAEPPKGKNVPPEKPFTTDDPDMKEVIWKRDGAKMVWIPEMWGVVPAKVIAATYDKFGDLITAETMIPEKTVKVFDAFYMDVYEVTVGQFKKFLKSSSYEPDEPIDWTSVYGVSSTEKHPMIMVTWHDATAYAKWAGKRLPTEKEWEWAARGGLENREFLWGDEEILARDYANYDGTGGDDRWEYTAPVGSFRLNGYGLSDMSGNLWEWCQDWYSSDQISRVLRGGSWYHGPDLLQVARRNYYAPSYGRYDSGFRCVSGSDYP